MFASVGQRQQVFGYVMQEETLVDVLTVREALAFSASLRGTCSRNDIAFSVEAMMAELGLEKQQRTTPPVLPPRTWTV